MSCRRAYDIDLAGFLSDPRAPGLADFVEHYPRCPDCAAEVRAWTEVHLTLAGRHPSPAELLAYHDGALAGDAREPLARHLATCPGCAEELRAIGRFDATRTEAVAPPAPRRSGAGSVTARLGHLLWHPAVGYAVALLLLVPLLAQRRRETPPSVSMPVQAEPSLRGPSTRAYEAAEPAPSPPPAETWARDAAPGAAGLALRKQERADSAPQPSTAGSAASGAQTRAPVAPASSSGPTIDRDRRRLTIPLSPSLRGRGSIEVRIRDAADTRELRQRVTAPRAADDLVIELPQGWLTPGAWSVELEAADQVSRLPLRVP